MRCCIRCGFISSVLFWLEIGIWVGAVFDPSLGLVLLLLSLHGICPNFDGTCQANLLQECLRAGVIAP